MKRKVMSTGIILLGIAVLLLGLCSCKNVTEEKLSFPDQTEDSYTSPSQPEVFDFSELSEDTFPRGKWSVNRLIDKYGEPERITANYVSGYEIVYVTLEYENLRINFAHENAELFSFSDSVTVDGDYALNDADKDLEIEILAVSVYGSDAKLPKDFKIGQSTKKQIIDSYPANSSYTLNDSSSDIDLVSYYYAFPDEDGNLPEWNEFKTGSIEYLFDENEILAQVIVAWWSLDI